jgi:glycosyltransferase involved in cell wall biosynthesis
MKICIFPNDPILAYWKKGEIKERYFNPKNIFDEVHIISFADEEVEESKVEKIAGTGKLKIHKVGKINIKNRKKEVHKILDLVKKISPNVIRAYNPLVEGWCASYIAQKLDIPFFVSLHTQYDYNRKLIRKKNLKKYLVLKYSEKFIEPYVLKNANKISIVYKIIEPYVLKNTSIKPELLYNKVNCEKFFNANIRNDLAKPLILSVGNLIESKNHELLIESMKKINANLLIIGKGELYTHLKNKIKMNNLEKKISILESVPYEKIPQYYKSADIFALAYDPNQEGLPMPVMEAMSAGTPVVIPKSLDSEELSDSVVFSERNVDSFYQKINELLENDELRMKCIQNGLKKAQNFDMDKLEKRESELYEELIKI